MSVLDTSSAAVHPARTGPHPLTPEDLWRLPRVGAPAPLPDGRAAIVPVTTYDLEKNEGRSRLWWVAADGGEPRALTSEDATSASPAVAPDGRTLAFTRKTDGGKAQLHLMPLDGGESRRVTDLPLGAFDPRWLPDGSGVVFAAMLLRDHLTPEATRTELERREKDPVKAHVTEERFYRYWDTWLTTGEVPHLFLYDLATGSVRDLTPESTLWFEWMDPSGQFDVAPDGGEVAFAGIDFDAERSLIRTRIYTVPVAGGPLTCITTDGTGLDAAPRYSPDGATIVFGQQHDPYFYADRTRLVRHDRRTRRNQEWLADWKLSPSHWEFAPDGTLVLLAERDARVHLFTWSGSGEPAAVVSGGTLAGLAPARDGRLWFTMQSLVQPPEVAVARPDGSDLRTVSRFTAAVTAGFATGEVREMTFEGAYGETVHMYVVLPPGFEAGHQYPLVQVVHGGPHGVSGDVFQFRWNAQAFAAPGRVVALVNFQGSTSWGQDFAQRIQGAWGDRPLTDVLKATDLLVESGLVDEKRMAAAGGSYGGYMASWIEANTDRFRCIVNHAGVYNLLSQYASDVTQGRAKSMGGEPWANIEGIDRYNPARNAKGFVTPMLVIHGERDYRVPVTQGLECYGVLKAKGVVARLVYFPDENHWILKPANSLLWYREVLGWLARHLD